MPGLDEPQRTDMLNEIIQPKSDQILWIHFYEVFCLEEWIHRAA